MSPVRVRVAGRLAELTRYTAEIRKWGRWKQAGQVETIETDYGLYVQGLYVEIPYRRQGIAALLMRQVIRSARGRRIELICTPASTAITEGQLAGFYQRLGFGYAPTASEREFPLESDGRRMARPGRTQS